MNKLVIIGNGFDLAHGLKTSYSDFIVWYLNKVLKIEGFKKEGSLITIHSRHAYEEIDSFEDFNELLNHPNFNVDHTDSFFKRLFERISEGWVDVETEYFSFLILWVDALLKDTNEITIKNSQLRFIIELNKSLDIITLELKEYLKDIKANSVDRDVRSNLYEILADDNYVDQQIMYLNFNYTSTIELYLGEFDKDKVNYIHGNLRDENNPIIFGYGDESNEHYKKIENLNNNELTRHLKSFSYLKTHNYQRLFNFLEKGEFNVYIMGHSCGISDRVLFTNIFNHDNFKNGRLNCIIITMELKNGIMISFRKHKSFLAILI